MEPEHFEVKPTADEQAEFEKAILFGYQKMDWLLGRFFKLAGPDTTLIFCTAFSQQPCLKYEEIGGKLFYRPRNFEDVIRFAGIKEPHTVSPVMSEQFRLFFKHESSAVNAEDRLKALHIEGQPAIGTERRGNELFAACVIYDEIPQDALLTSGDSKACKFFSLFYKIEGMKSGMHHPDGMLWVSRPSRKHVLHPGKASLTMIAPMILKLFDLPQPATEPAQTLVHNALS